MADNIIEKIEDIDTTLNPITKDYGLEMLGNVSDQPVVLRRFSRAIFKVGGLIKGLGESLVPKTRKINGKALSTDITLSAEDVKAKNRRVGQKFIVGGVSNMYYPVKIGMNPGFNFTSERWSITRLYSAPGPNDWNTTTHKGALQLDILQFNNGWGGNKSIFNILDFQENYAELCGGIIREKFGMQTPIVWLRGGNAEYTLTHSRKNDVSITPYYVRSIAWDYPSYPEQIVYVEPRTLAQRDVLDIEKNRVAKEFHTHSFEQMTGCPHGIGDYWITESTSNPATKWTGTTWTKLEGRVLLGTSSSYALGTQGGRSTVALTLANIAAHTHGFSGTTNTTGNHYHQGGNHRHKVDNHAHTQPSHRHQIKVGRNDDGYGGYVSTALGNYVGWKTDPCNSAGGENTGGSSPYTNYQNPNTSTTGNHNHTISGTTGSSGSGSAVNIMNPYRVVNIWRRTA